MIDYKHNRSEPEPGSIFLTYTASEAARSALLYIQHVGHHRFRSDSLYFEREDFRSIHLVYTLEGKGHLHFRNEEYTIVQGQVMLINCCDHHIMHSDRELGWHYKWIHFSGLQTDSLYEMFYDKFGPVIDVNQSRYVSDSIDLLINHTMTRHMNVEMSSSNILHNILTHIYLQEPSSVNGISKANQRIIDVINYIEQNFASKIAGDDIARISCYSKFHFTRLFRSYTGFNPHEYVIKCRINKSKSLLSTSNHTVNEIADEVGFESAANFINTFKRLEGITPNRYRKSQIY